MKTLKRLFITGGTGFIGSRLVRALLADGYEVGVLVREGSDPSRPGWTGGRLSVFTGDVRDSAAVFRSVGEFAPDAILHLVTTYAVEHSSADIGVMMDTNVKGTVSLLEAAKEHGVSFFVNTSTCAVYEQKDRRLSEDDPVSPQNLYAVTKLQAEEACRFYALNYGVSGITLRLFPPYGPGDHERRLIPYVITSVLENRSPALTTGRQEWDFVYVDDVVDAFRAVLRSYPFGTPYDVVNIGTGAPVSIRDVVSRIMEKTHGTCPLSWGAVPHRKNEVWFNSADIAKAKRVLGWEPATGIREGLDRTIASIVQKRKG
jgi:nucleoside-diphosphate-sugar epimerase